MILTKKNDKKKPLALSATEFSTTHACAAALCTSARLAGASVPGYSRFFTRGASPGSMDNHHNYENSSWNGWTLLSCWVASFLEGAGQRAWSLFC